MVARHDRVVMCGATNIGHMQLRRPIELLPNSMVLTLKDTVQKVAPNRSPVPQIVPDRETSPIEQMKAVLGGTFRPNTSHYAGAYVPKPSGTDHQASQNAEGLRKVVVLHPSPRRSIDQGEGALLPGRETPRSAVFGEDAEGRKKSAASGLSSGAGGDPLEGVKDEIRIAFGKTCGLSSGETRRAFLVMDRDRDGYVSERDLRETMHMFNVFESGKEAKNLLRAARKGGGGKGWNYGSFRKEFEPVGRGVFNPFKPEVPLHGMEPRDDEPKVVPSLNFDRLWAKPSIPTPRNPRDVLKSSRRQEQGSGGGGLRPMESNWSLCQSARGPIFRPNTAREEQTLTQQRTARSLRESERTATVRSAYSRYLAEDYAKRNSQGQEAENERAAAREYLRLRSHKVFTEHVPERMARPHDPQIHKGVGEVALRKDSGQDVKKRRRRSSQAA